jgi:hypothetical protein
MIKNLILGNKIRISRIIKILFVIFYILFKNLTSWSNRSLYFNVSFFLLLLNHAIIKKTILVCIIYNCLIMNLCSFNFRNFMVLIKHRDLLVLMNWCYY